MFWDIIRLLQKVTKKEVAFRIKNVIFERNYDTSWLAVTLFESEISPASIANDE